VLTEIIAHKRQELEAINRPAEIERLKDEVLSRPPVYSLAEALSRSADIALIAEIKRKSPSKGVLANGIDPAAVARTYQQAGASAVSVLTDEKYFAGTIADLQAVRSEIDLPILRKDFIIDVYQLYQARAVGADVVLLIAAALDPGMLERLYHKAYDLGLEVLVEVHDQDELEKIIPFRPRIVGVNNRNLNTFTTDLATAEQLRDSIPADSICVAESGIHSRDDMVRMERAGYNAVLIGEGIITAPDRGVRIKELLGTHAHAN